MGMGCFEAEMQLRNTLRRSKMLQLSWDAVGARQASHSIDWVDELSSCSATAKHLDVMTKRRLPFE